MRVDWLGELRTALRIAPRRRTARMRRRQPSARTASFELLEDRTLLAIDLSVPIFASGATIGSGIGGGPAVADLSNFGTAIAPLSDLDGDGIADMAIGAASDRTSGLSRGAVFIEFMNADGTVKSSQKIASNIGGGPTLANGDLFGTSLAALGDLDGDGITELAVGASLNDTGGTNRGAVHVLFMKADGTVKSSVKIAGGVGGGPAIANYDYFGSSIAAIGDLDGDGVRDMAVGAKLDDTGGENRGALYVMFMNANGTAKTNVKIASGTIGAPILHDNDRLGSALAAVGDLDGDGVTDLAVSSFANDGVAKNRGAVNILFMHADGTVKSSQSIASGVGGGPSLTAYDQFGSALAAVGDLDGDGINDLAVGANYDDTAGSERGAVYFLLMNSDGTAKNVQKMTSGRLGGPTLADGDYFGGSLALVGDLNGDGLNDLAIGAATDDTGGVNRGVVHVLLREKNESPQITSSDLVSVLENSTAVHVVTATDADLPPDTLTFSIVGGVDQALFVITAGGELSFVAPPDFELPTDVNGDNRYEVVVEVSDGHFGTATQTIQVDVMPVSDNTPQITSSDIVSVAENSSAVLTVTATDADLPGDALDFSITGGADQSLFSLTSTGELSFIAAPDFELPTDTDGNNHYEVAVRVSDGHGGTATQTITVEVTPTNDNVPQITSADNVSIAENSTVVLTATATDADEPAATLTFSIVGGADQAQFSITPAGELSFVAAPDFEQPTDTDGDNQYEVVVEVSDGDGGSATQTIRVDVTPVNDHAPEIASPNVASVEENVNAAIIVIATDADLPTDTFAFSIVGGADQALFAITSGGELSFVVAPDFELPTDADGDNRYEVAVEVSDGHGGVATQNIDVFVTAINDNQPLITSADTASVPENSSAVFTVVASDADLPGDTFAFSIVGGVDLAHFAITSGGELSFTTAPDFELPTDAEGDNQYEVIVEVNDGHGGTATQTIRVNVTPTSDNGPQITSLDSASVDENSTTVLSVAATDADLPAETLTFSIVGGADQTQFTVTSAGELSFISAPDFELPTDADSDNHYEVIVEANDGSGGLATQTIHVFVTALNDNQPLITSADTASIAENSTAVHSVMATDADLPLDTIAFAIVGGADQASFSITPAGELSFIAAPDFESPTDANGDNLYEVIVEASDGNGGTATQTITVEVTPANDNSPQFTSPDSASVAENSIAVLTVAANDADLPTQTLTYSIVGGADQAQFAITPSGELTFSAAPDFELPVDADGDNHYEVTVEASDVSGGVTTQTIQVFVTSLNDNQPFITSPDTATVAENSTAVVTVTATDGDLPADTVTFSIVGGADQAHFAITSGGELAFVVAPDFEIPIDADGDNRYELVVEANDGSGGTATQTIIVEIAPANDSAPQFTSPDSTSIAENSAAVLTAAATDADLPAQGLVFAIVGGADQAQFAVTPGGDLTFNAAPDFEVPADVDGDNRYEVIVEANDGSGGVAIQTIHVLVTALNDNQPVFTTADVAAVVENSTAVLTVTATDADLPADAITFSIVGGADQAHFAITAGGELAFVVAPDFELPIDAGGDNRYEVVIKANDGSGGTVTQTISVEVTSVNDNSPAFTSADSVSVAENSTAVATVTATDGDLPADTITFSIVGGTDQTQFTITPGGELAFVAAPDFELPTDVDGNNRYEVIVEANDGNGGTATQTISVEVTPVEEEPPGFGSSGAASLAIDLALVDWPTAPSSGQTSALPGNLLWSAPSSDDQLLIATLRTDNGRDTTPADESLSPESGELSASESDDFFAVMGSLLTSPAI